MGRGGPGWQSLGHGRGQENAGHIFLNVLTIVLGGAAGGGVECAWGWV